MSKIKFVILFVVNTVVVSSLYYFAANELHFPAVALIYMIMSLFAVCAYAFLCMQHNNDIAKARLEGKEPDKALVQFRKHRLRLFIVFFFPFVITFLADCTYMFFLSGNPLFENILNSLK